jgi:hypothetical protein
MATKSQAIADDSVDSSVDRRSGPQGDFHAELERALIVTYLRRRGYTLGSVDNLPRDEAQAILKAANTYAALRLTELEARMRYLDALHGHA